MKPQIHSPIDFDIFIPKINKFQTQNGINIYSLINHSNDAVQIEWTFNAGIWHESQPGVAITTGRILKNGTSKYSEFDINEQLEFLGSSLRVSVNNDYTQVVLMTLNKHLPLLLPIVKEIITDAHFSENELKIYISNALQALKTNLLKVDFVANRFIEEQLFGIQHPYGRYLVSENYNRITREHLLDFHRKHYRYDNCTVFMAGGIHDKNMELFIEIFGSDQWNASTHDIDGTSHEVKPHSDKYFHHEINPNNVQSAVRMASHTIHHVDADFLTLQFLNVIFGGYFSSRLMSNIREDKGYTYGIYSYLACHKHNSFLIVSTEVDKTFTEATIDEIKYEMKNLMSTPIPEDELLLAKNYIIGSLIADLDGVFSMIQMWKSMILLNQDEQYFYNRLETFKKLNAEELQAIAVKFLNPENFYTVVVQ